MATATAAPTISDVIRLLWSAQTHYGKDAVLEVALGRGVQRQWQDQFNGRRVIIQEFCGQPVVLVGDEEDASVTVTPFRRVGGHLLPLDERWW